MQKGKTFQLYIRGPNACFTRPEMKVERVSYEVPTPSAMRGVLEAIFWKPAFRWVIERIDVLRPIRWETVKRNEITKKASPKTKPIYIDEENDRKQRINREIRNALVLKDVAYVIHAHQELTGKEPEGNDLSKLSAMFERRASKGQYFHHPYLGTREFAVEELGLLSEGETPPTPVPIDKDLGWMLYDLDFSNPKNPVPLFFHAKLEQGILRVPDPRSEEVKR